MTYTDFVKTVESTSWHQPNERLLHAAMGLCTETAELFEIDNEQHQLEELGDICWYLALGLDAIGHSFEAVPLLETEDFLNKVRGEDPGQALVIYSSDLLDMVKKQVFYGREIDATKAVDAFVLEFQGGKGQALGAPGHEEVAAADADDVNQEKIVKGRRG